ncbi:MAG: MerR family transcriptional regulator [Gemmobacter sp.]|uniref:MerR family transcriptional regulator n=1 Tax=Gemmobacter sp. TaxID=1898957 RepID=UPI001A4EB5F2|nr:MerR family transcriptional regulator [Gemmobacter sp.]MBL8562128.1 MerR family transcriptional regulator [Gemmobacter sp.]
MDKSPDAFRTISEVADFLETPAHVLRFWESRFPQIKPVKRAGGRRYYRPADVALLAGIRQLLHQDGMTIRGVQKILRDQGVRHVIALSDPNFPPASVPEDEAFDGMAEPTPDEAEDGSNIVALTDWRFGTAAPEPAVRAGDGDLPWDSPEAAATPTAAPELLAEALPPAPELHVGAASLVADPDSLSAADPASEEEPTLPSPAPLQWSLFDAIAPEDSAPAADLPQPEAEAPLAQASPPDLPLAQTVLSEADDPPQAQPDESPAHEAAETIQAPPAPTSNPSGPDLPWLPPRLRALHAALDGQARPDLAPVLARARALHARLRDAAQSRRG